MGPKLRAPDPRTLEKARAALAFALGRCEAHNRRGRTARPGSALEELEGPAHNLAEALREALEEVEAGDLAAALFIVADRLGPLVDMMPSTAAGMLAKAGAAKPPKPGKRPRGRPSAPGSALDDEESVAAELARLGAPRAPEKT